MKKKPRVQKQIRQIRRHQHQHGLHDDAALPVIGPLDSSDDGTINISSAASDQLVITERICNHLTIQLLEWAVANAQFPNSHVVADRMEENFRAVVRQLCRDSGWKMPEMDSKDFLQWLLDQITRLHVTCVLESGKKCVATLARLKQATLSAIAAACNHDQFIQSVDQASMNSLYQLAYGLSHEINNPVANIAARAQQMIGSASANDQKSLATIVDQSMRAHEMVAEMMRVVQPRKLFRQPVNVGALLGKVADGVQTACDASKIQLQRRITEASIWANLDPRAITEAMENICKNAIQVCGPADTIEIICCELADRNGARFTDSWLRIAIRDTGPGMSPETANNAWNLYFSGKEHGRGLGISLAQVKQIVNGHEGKIWIESQPEAGCTFEIRIPICEPPIKKSQSLVL